VTEIPGIRITESTPEIISPLTILNPVNEAVVVVGAEASPVMRIESLRTTIRNLNVQEALTVNLTPVVLDSDPRMSVRGPTGFTGSTGPTGPTARCPGAAPQLE
jgi:hypothetical protein